MRFLESKNYYLDLVYRALAGHFSNRTVFEEFFEAIQTDNDKDALLRVGTYYLFLVKSGDWIVDDVASNRLVDYFTNSYKLVTLLSLIESLGNGDYLDFYQSLVSKKSGADFPLTRAVIDERYDRYKAQFGSFRRCTAFFEGLDNHAKARLKAAFTGADEDVSIKDVVRFLYEFRSKFVHEGRLILHLSEVPALLMRKGQKPLLVRLAMPQVCEAFEFGLIAHFTPK